MKNEPYYLKCYQEWLSTGEMPGQGLCGSFGFEDKLLKEMFEPLDYTRFFLWASDDLSGNKFKFTTLRQTILLFMAAMNNEL